MGIGNMYWIECRGNTDWKQMGRKLHMEKATCKGGGNIYWVYRNIGKGNMLGEATFNRWRYTW